MMKNAKSGMGENRGRKASICERLPEQQGTLE